MEHDPTTTYGGNSMNNNEIMKCSNARRHLENAQFKKRTYECWV